MVRTEVKRQTGQSTHSRPIHYYLVQKADAGSVLCSINLSDRGLIPNTGIEPASDRIQLSANGITRHQTPSLAGEPCLDPAPRTPPEIVVKTVSCRNDRPRHTPVLAGFFAYGFRTSVPRQNPVLPPFSGFSRSLLSFFRTIKSRSSEGTFLYIQTLNMLNI